jgi:(p)ppGpp synthase/HD superfamily hydrolase
MSSLEERARDFATAQHAAIDQRRKYTGEPYIHHPAAVAELVRSVPHTEEMIAAAWLHDTVEDTSATLDEVRARFGDAVAALVEHLTDVSKPEDGNRAQRKAIDLAHTAKASPDAKTVKLADLIDNSRSILERDPEFARVYIEEKRRLLEVLREGDPTLYSMANRIVVDAQGQVPPADG